MKFKGKIVWITGASSGIGEALSQQFAREGARLILSARRTEELQRVKSSLNLAEKDCFVLPLDLEQPDTFPDRAQQVLKLFNRIDLVIHNGGISQRSWVKDTPLVIDQKVMAVNYFGPVALTKAILPYFLEQQHGHFVVISSLVGRFGTPLRSAYAASKHALHGFFESLRAETWRENIQVTMVCPGYIKTNISLNAVTATGEKHNHMDANQQKGMPAEVCARKILEAVATGKYEIIIGGKETLGVYLKRFFPGILNKVVRKINNENTGSE